jgi:hypothetical protein
MSYRLAVSISFWFGSSNLDGMGLYFFLRDLCGGGVGAGTADFGSDAKWPTAALNLAAAAGPSLKSSGPRCGLPSDDDDLGGII